MARIAILLENLSCDTGISCRLNAALLACGGVAAWKDVDLGDSIEQGSAPTTATYDTAMRSPETTCQSDAAQRDGQSMRKFNHLTLATLSPSVAIQASAIAAFVPQAFSASVRVRGRHPAAFQTRLVRLTAPDERW